MKRKKAVIYIRLTLTDERDTLVHQTEAWAKRHRLVVTEILIDESPRQPRFLRRLSNIRSKRLAPDIIIAPSIFHFSTLPKFLHTLARLESTDTGVAFVQENILLHGSAATTRRLYQVAAAYVTAEKFGRSQSIKQSLRVAAIFGQRLGKPQLSQALQHEVESHLSAGKSLRQVVQAMDGRVSRSSVAKIRKGLKNE